jgi:two-component system sensor histidine kinase DegS
MVKDDGYGFKVSEGLPAVGHPTGIGLLSMKERLSSLDGSMAIHSTPGRGTVLRIKVPIREGEIHEAH